VGGGSVFSNWSADPVAFITVFDLVVRFFLPVD
jgi:hypothetical protein